MLALLVCTDFAHAAQTRFDLTQLKAPPGFHISVFANEIDGARMLIFSPGGVLLASESGEGKVVALPDPKHVGKAARTVTVLSGLNEPHGLAFYEGKLYVAENDKVRRYDWDEATLRASNPICPRAEGTQRAAFCFTAARCIFPPDRVAMFASKKICGARP
jgi:glucose/arabinose dehydrogenase